MTRRTTSAVYGLGAEREDARRDVQPARELLVGEHRRHGRVADDRLGLVGVQRADHLAQRRDDRQVRCALAVHLEHREQPPAQMQGIGRADRDEARRGRDALARQGAQADGDPGRHVGRVVGHQGPQPGGARGGEQAVRAQVRLGRVWAGQVRLELGAPQARVGDDRVEVLDELLLRQRGQGGEVDVRVGGVGAEHLAVVRGALDGMAQEPVQALALMREELLARPRVVAQQLAGERAHPLDGGPGGGRRCGDGHALSLTTRGARSGAGRASPRL